MRTQGENTKRRGGSLSPGSAKRSGTSTLSCDSKVQYVRTVAKAFCEFLYAVPKGRTFSLRNLQGSVRVYDPNPATQTFATHLRLAIEYGWIKPVPNKPDVYLRTGFKKSSYAYYALTSILKDKILAALGDKDYQWMLPPSQRTNQQEGDSHV